MKHTALFGDPRICTFDPLGVAQEHFNRTLLVSPRALQAVRLVGAYGKQNRSALVAEVDATRQVDDLRGARSAYAMKAVGDEEHVFALVDGREHIDRWEYDPRSHHASIFVDDGLRDAAGARLDFVVENQVFDWKFYYLAVCKLRHLPTICSADGLNRQADFVQVERELLQIKRAFRARKVHVVYGEDDSLSAFGPASVRARWSNDTTSHHDAGRVRRSN